MQGLVTLLRSVATPMSAWSARARWIGLALAVAGGVAVTLLLVPLASVFHAPDSSHYLLIAQGRTAEVEQPFASRQLGPLVAAALGRLLRGDLHLGFLAQAALSLPFTMGVVCWFALRTAAPRWMLAALMLVPSWALAVHFLVLPDLWYAALLAALLLLLQGRHFLAAALMMFPLMLSRESTSLTLLCFLLAAWKDLRWRDRIAAVLAAAAGSVVVGHLAAGSRPNVEHLPQAVYLFAKLPWNLLRNVVGVLPWSDANRDLCAVPVWSMPFQVGPVHRIGICGFSLGQQLLAVEGTLTNFGVLPLMAAVLWWRHRRWRGRSALLRFCLLYGGVSFLLTPLLGAGFVHLMQYSWPLFLVALPQLFHEFRTERSAHGWLAGLGVFALHLAAGGISYWPVFLPMIEVGLVLWLAAYLLLRRWLANVPEAKAQPYP